MEYQVTETVLVDPIYKNTLRTARNNRGKNFFQKNLLRKDEIQVVLELSASIFKARKCNRLYGSEVYAKCKNAKYVL